jgi:seryl-tRNA synthetase
MNRRQVEKAGYLHSFPHLLGCVCGLQGEEAEIHGAVRRFNAGEEWTDALKVTDLVLTPAACYPLYPMVAARGAVPAKGLMFDVESYCFRRESTFEVDRLQAFRMREYVCMGAPDDVVAFRHVARRVARRVHVEKEAILAADGLARARRVDAADRAGELRARRTEFQRLARAGPGIGRLRRPPA